MKKALFFIALCAAILSTGCDSSWYPYYLRFETIDFLIIRYYWESSGGTDLDTRTALIDPDREIDVGWNRPSADGEYLIWGSDNTGSGYEAVLLDLEALRTDFPDNEVFDIRMRAFWYGSRNSGDFNIEFTGYLGGEMVQDGFNWVNEGGREVRSIDVERNVFTNISNDVAGEDLGTARYHVESKALEILDP